MSKKIIFSIFLFSIASIILNHIIGGIFEYFGLINKLNGPKFINETQDLHDFKSWYKNEIELMTANLYVSVRAMIVKSETQRKICENFSSYILPISIYAFNDENKIVFPYTFEESIYFENRTWINTILKKMLIKMILV